jgi:hypothetical protein
MSKPITRPAKPLEKFYLQLDKTTFAIRKITTFIAGMAVTCIQALRMASATCNAGVQSLSSVSIFILRRP